MNQTTIRAELKDYLKRKCITINQFAEASGVNSGTLSSIINASRVISMLQLDRITESMGLLEGSFYDLYIDDCVNHSTINWRRLQPLLFRCADLGRLDCIERVLCLVDSQSYVSALFDTAEKMFKEGNNEAARLLYENVAANEKYQHSERLALCQYRLFKITLCDDHELNIRAAVQFEGFVDKLDEMDQLDALKDLANTYLLLNQSDKMEKLAKDMGRIATIQYKYRYEQPRKVQIHKEPSMPLFAYILYAHVLCSSACANRGEYDQGLYYISLYSDLSWVQEDTEEAHRRMNECKMWAKANSYLFRLMKGEIEVIPEYVNYIESYENEMLLALFMILQVANRYHSNIDEILLRFKQIISEYIDQKGKVTTNQHQRVVEDRFAYFMAELSTYYMSNERYEIGIEYMLKGLDSSLKINSRTCVIRFVCLFEQYRFAVSPEVQKKYKSLFCEEQREYKV
ncbi:helix-turn-helix domain-containing protein [Paenibacillus segetis]|uniref:HTH cro/C1-type domain-containing protein n=1 Tax=Paenibacillus segetis TaxID=1325360 RepID=A0ABQ1YMK7_9BACL|nr:helix-turn-helix transcriptional regulator [Paenibacillus segetis]GGH29692.1 hypothetical protein GCM10008013_32430 [Paenibacillus segetis]